jgi:hypothetical protein
MKITPKIAEIIGALIGDGYIYQNHHKYQIGLVGNPITDKNYFKKLKQLLLEEWKKEVKIKFRSGGIRIVFNSKEICKFLIECLNLAHGKDKCQRVIIPEEIYKNWDLAKYAIRGIIDTDGSVFASKKPGIDKCPCIEITTTSKGLLGQLNKLLTERGFRVNTRLEKRIKRNPNALPSYKLSLNGKKNLQKWLEEIGFSNDYKLNRALSYL